MLAAPLALPPPPRHSGLRTSAWVALHPTDGNTGLRVIAQNAGQRLRIASVGKVLLLIEVARQLENGDLSADELLNRAVVAPVSDSGVWQHLAVGSLSVTDAAVLVGACSDNLATNVLIDRVGLPRVRHLADHLGLSATGLHDVVRDDRGASDPPELATGTAEELGTLVKALREGAVVSADVSDQVRTWLTFNSDLSMVASAFDLDPLAHVGGPLGLFNKTGTDDGVRVEIGSMGRACEGADYAVLTNWDPADPSAVHPALAWMRAVGEWLRSMVGPTGTRGGQAAQ